MTHPASPPDAARDGRHDTPRIAPVTAPRRTPLPAARWVGEWEMAGSDHARRALYCCGVQRPRRDDSRGDPARAPGGLERRTHDDRRRARPAGQRCRRVILHTPTGTRWRARLVAERGESPHPDTREATHVCPSCGCITEFERVEAVADSPPPLDKAG